ncbi:SDR family NAD(P)-dependent oxidoreductase [Massilia sp. DJPM01]|uniref:SDR family NAD(P)-dependent oxidoreductase n=1 Tax=Massilia sp. DJPM01 TaxID=3024404 RepID=UPI00259F88A4|nr:SDR family NAD(P)-dependent oxidoreductase [Massilia sp. DJPM01]MDM5176107.1 SDR family NAD(P)-dependent oxidoreductase [Massilia sp. DJPM01]
MLNFLNNFKRKPGKPEAVDTPDDVAIIGLSLRLPQADTLDEFWTNLMAQKSSITEVPAQRWDKQAYYGDPRKADDKTNSIWGGFVDHADCFDAEFFKISPREAQNMDPQQRFAMELSWKAIEDAGYRPSQLAGSNTGVYMGVCHWDYAELFEKTGQKVDAYFPTGTAYSIIANRISHYFDFAGPSIINDTACASSLVSVYQAVRALQNGECDTALAGGVNLCWSVNHFIAFSKNGMLSKDGLCKAFDSSADGYVRGEGGAVLLLKPLRQAQADGDLIHAVIKGIGTNHGGRTNSLTVTNPKAQARLISQIYRKAGIAPDSVSYIEAHGPGTPLGDPVEVMGLKTAFRDLHERLGTTAQAASCGLGSVKTNIGHLEGAAGVAGMIKVVAAMQHQTLPGNVNFQRLNPLIKLEDSPFFVVSETTPWHRGALPLRAGVSSFGFGGSNAHVILEEFVAQAGPNVALGPVYLVPVSARDAERLRESVSALLDYVTSHKSVDLGALAYTLQTGREAMAERTVFAVSDGADLTAKLEAWLAGKKNIAQCWRGQQDQGGKLVDLLAADDGYRALLQQWAANGQLDKLAELWAQGGELDWQILYAEGKPQKLRLPTYPFAKVRHWFADSKVRADSQAQAAQIDVLHPLLHKNISTLKQQIYSAEFSGREFFLADHVVAHNKVMPGVAYLEMVRAALALALDGGQNILLKNVVWTRPLAIGDQPVTVQLGLLPQAGGDIAYTVSSMVDGQPVVHSQGRALVEENAQHPVLDLAQLKAACAHMHSVPDCYARLAAAGMAHGPSLQGLASVHAGERQVLAQLRLPEVLAAQADQYFLHPAMLDSAIQGTVALLGGERPALPFALEELRIIAPCTPHMWAWIRYSDASAKETSMPKFDIDICNERAEVCVRMSGLSLRLLEAPANAVAPALPVGMDVLYSRSEWHERPLVPAAPAVAGAPALSVFLALPADQPALLQELSERLGAHVEALILPPLAQAAEGLESALLTVLRRVQKLMAERSKVQVCIVVPESEGGRLLAPLASLLKTASQESSRVQGKLITVAGLESLPADQLADLIRAEIGAADQFAEIRIGQDGLRQVRLAREIVLPPAAGWGFKEGGVYWITGGLGGLGALVGDFLANTRDVTLVLSGRSPARGRDAALRARGVTVDYMEADIGIAADVQQVVAAIIEKYGALNGIVHCAGVLQDAFIANKTEQQVAAVFGPKVHGVVNIDQATRDIDLDFLLLFSSVAAINGGAGQSDYGVANAFLDAYASHRQAQVQAGLRRGQTIAVNWPLWAAGGMQMDEANVDAMRRRTGMQPLPTAQGLGAMAAILASGQGGQVAVSYGQADALRHFMAAQETRKPDQPPAAVAAPAGASIEAQTLTLLKETLGKVLKLDPAKIRSSEKFEQYGFDSIMAVDMTLQLEERIGSLPKTLFFEYVDLQGIATYLLEEHLLALTATLSTPAKTGPATMGMAEKPLSMDPAPVAAAVPVANRFTALAALPPAPAESDYHDIAVIGLAGRYPHADTMEQFWEVLKNGRHCFEKIPSERWRHAGIYHDERDILGKSTIKNGSFLSDIDKFDPRYFNMSQRDAELMSPEVRLFLQVGVEAFEDAGYSREQMHKQYDGDVGVLVGTMSNHYGLLGFQNMLTRGARANGSYTGTLPNMLSYFYGFSGPSIFMDTMCSAASTCIDQAVHMLRGKQCKMVLAGGANLLLHPYNFISSSQEHFTTKTSELIRSYGLGADGTILGEGVGAVLLKPLVEAIKDKDHIYGIIKGTAINNAGVRNGFTVPSPTMQAKVVQKALRDAAIDPRTVSYLEGHGSGTKLGDPIEIKALTQAYRAYTDTRQFCPIGSVKSNIAHLLAAAGVAGFTKVLLQLKHKQIVPSLHSAELNPDIPFAESPFYVQRELSDWQRPTLIEDGVERVYPRRAGVTSIGAGGMNSHIIVEEYAQPSALSGALPQPRLVLFSAMSKAMLHLYLERMRSHLEQHPDTDLASLSYTLQVGRNALPCRFATVISTSAQLVQAMAAFVQGEATPAVSFVENILASDDSFDDAEVAHGVAAGDLARIAHCWAQGASIDWDRLWNGQLPYKISLPNYPFEKIRCWYELDAEAPTLDNPLSTQRKLHPFMGRNASDLASVRYVSDFRIDDVLDYAFHRGARQQILPTFVLDTALALARVSGVQGSVTLRNLVCHGDIDWGLVKHLQSAIAADGENRFEGHIVWLGQDGVAQLLARFQLQGDSAARSAAAPLDVSAVPVRRSVSATGFYDELKEGGLDYAPYLESVQQVRMLASGACLVTVQEPSLKQHHFPANVSLAPMVLGALLQVTQFLAKQDGLADWAWYAPLAMDQLTLDTGEVAHLLFHGLSGVVDLLDADGATLGTLSGLRFGSIAPQADQPPAEAQTAVADAAAENTNIMTDLVAGIRARMAAILKFEAIDIDTRTPFYSLGFDSISMTELAANISAAFGVVLTPALFFEMENVDQLATHLLSTHRLKLQDRWRRDHQTHARITRPAVLAPPTLARRQPVAPATASQDMPIAIIGAAGKFPGAENLDAFWTNLHEGRNAIESLPMDRYGAAYQETVRAADFPKKAGILHSIDRFDAGFFNISPAEAELMDPQHRLFLEAVWSALENAAYRASGLPANTGVYVGVSATDYATLLTAHGVAVDTYTATGTAHSMLANRVSFFLDVHGPSQAIDTACSSSLVALHRAVESIRSGQCDMVIAGGVNVALSVDTFVGAHMAGMLSPDGQCKTFSERANGYVRGEGVAALVLKPLHQAERDGDTILGVILGSAENHGGRANSLTAPNPRAQAELLETAMRGIDPASIGYIETHGTGTSLGDPVEISGLKLAFANLQKEHGGKPLPEGHCGLGSVKSNIGHLEAAAGIAGVVKVLLSMQHGLLPASLHCDVINPYIDLAGSPFHIVRERSAWPQAQDERGQPLPRRAGVSSFGFGGANAHVVLEEYLAQPAAAPLNAGPYLIVLSARSEDRLRRAARNLYMLAKSAVPQAGLMERIAYTLQVGREAMQERLALSAGSLDELADLLLSFLESRALGERLLRGSVKRVGAADRLPAPPHASAQQLLRNWVDGQFVDWDRLYQHRPRRMALPTYPFAPDRYWIPNLAKPFDELLVGQVLDDVLADAVSLDEAIVVLKQAGYGLPE